MRIQGLKEVQCVLHVSVGELGRGVSPESSSSRRTRFIVVPHSLTTGSMGEDFELSQGGLLVCGEIEEMVYLSRLDLTQFLKYAE